MKTPQEFDYKRIWLLRCHAVPHGLSSKHVLKFLVHKYMLLGDCLEGIQVCATFVADKENFAHTSFAEHMHHLKLRNLHFTQDTVLACLNFECFLLLQSSRKGLSGKLSLVVESEANVVSVPVPLIPLTRMEVIRKNLNQYEPTTKKYIIG